MPKQDSNNQDDQKNSNEDPPKKNGFGKALLVGAALYMAFNIYSGANDNNTNPDGEPDLQTDIPNVTLPASASGMQYSDFLFQLEKGNVSQVIIQNQGADKVISVTLNNGRTSKMTAMDDPGLINRLQKAGVPFTQIATPPPPEASGGQIAVSLLMSLAPMILIIGFIVWKMKQQGGGGQLGFGKSKAKLFTGAHQNVTFKDVAGIDEAKEDLMEIVDFLKNPERYEALGAKIPTGALLVGPPGTGKTLTARAVAGESGVPFYSVSGSDFIEMFVGVGAGRVRDMFAEARKNAPCIIFIDEIDSIGSRRGGSVTNGGSEQEQTLNALLAEMDGFTKNAEASEELSEGESKGRSKEVIIIAATNRAEVLDPALLRPGRLDRQVMVPNPDVTGREAILRVHMQAIPLAPDVDAHTIARGTPGFSGADMANLVNEAALLAARRNKKVVSMAEFESAKDKILMGAERKSMVMTNEERKNTAYHEAGHALVGLRTEPIYHPLHMVSILPRGRALGVTMNLPEKDIISRSEAQLKSQLAVLYGGRIAEELTNGKGNITTGASNDIEVATNIAREMVTRYGFSDLGPQFFGESTQASVFPSQTKNFSESTEKKIDEAINKILTTAEAKARTILEQRKDELEKIAEALLKYETLSGADVTKILNGEELDRETVITDMEEASDNKITPPKPPGREGPR